MARVTIAGVVTNGRDGMPQDVHFHVESVTSSDENIKGVNWSVVYVPTSTNNNAGTPLVTALSGNVLVSMTDRDLSPHNWTQRAGVKFLVFPPMESTGPTSCWFLLHNQNRSGILPLTDNDTTFEHAGGV